MPVPVTVPLAPQTRTPAIITIPGTKPPASRRHASNPATAITAYVLPGDGDKSSSRALTTISVAVKRNNRLLGYQLKGHDASIVDLEFLQTPAGSPIHVLGSCDRDGVVFLWFLYVAIDSLGIEKELCLLKKYSFFTLRKSTTAFYSRIRLAGSVEAGTMVLVPNDGASVRVVTFSCEATQPDTAARPMLDAAPQQAAPLPPPEYEETPSTKPLSTEALTGGAVAAGAVGVAAVGAAAVHETVVEDEDDEDDEADEVDEDPDQDLHVPEPPADPALRTFSEATPYERSMTEPLHQQEQALEEVAEEEEGDDDDEEEEVTGRMALNSTFPMSRAEGDQVEVEDDLAAAAAMAAGLPVTEMEGALHERDAATGQRELVMDGEEVEELDDGEDEDEEEFRDATGMVQGLRLDDNERDYIEDDEVEDVDDDDNLDGEEFNDAIGQVHGVGLGMDGRGDMVVEGEGLGGR